VGVFDSFREESYPHKFAVQLRLATIAGGVPSDKKVAEGWIKTKVGLDKDEEIQRMVAEAMVERGITQDEAAEEVARNKNLNGFKRDENGLYIEGRQIKSMLKEDISIAAATEKVPIRGWGKTSKWVYGFFAEHVFVPETTVYLKDPNSGDHVTEASEVIQRFVKTKMGQTGIQYEEVCYDVTVDFTVVTDYEFKARDWAMIWTTGEMNGLGASRSQGYGRYEVTRWEPVEERPVAVKLTRGKK
jgi:hypothetical protein